MISADLVHAALRVRLLTAVVATTGTTTLAATSTGYSRASGSFLTDGFASGMEILPAGFATNTRQIVADVTALTITTVDAPAVEASAGSRSLTAGLPLRRAWENESFDPTVPSPYIADQFGGSDAHDLITGPAEGALAEEGGLYFVTWFGRQNEGSQALRRSADAVRARFGAGYRATLSDGAVLRLGGPTVGQITRIDGGWAYVQVTVPWRASSINTIAA